MRQSDQLNLIENNEPTVQVEANTDAFTDNQVCFFNCD